MPLDQQVKGGHGEGEARLKIRPAPVHHFLEMTDERQHGEHRLDEHTVLPLPALTQFEIAGIALRGMEAGVTQDNHALLKLPNQPLKGVIRDIRGVTVPPHDQPPLIEQQTEFAPDNPPMVGEAFPANLLRAATFTDGMDQLNAIGVNDPEHGRSSEEDLRPVVMRREEPKESGALGSWGNNGP
jgi:hypothetical protein